MTSHLPPLQNFNCEGEAQLIRLKWLQWKRALEIFLIAANIENPESKRATLLHTGGVALQEILYNIPGALGTGNKNEDIYELAITKLDAYFSPKHNIIHERHLFRLIKQEDEEKFEAFLIKFREQAKKCQFTNTDEHIIDQIFDKCTMKELKRAILLMGNDELHLNKIIDEANALEMVSRQLQEYKEKKNKDDMNTMEILKGKKNKNEKCTRCGNVNHNNNYINCPARTKRCLKCKYIGHYKKFCLTKNTRLTKIRNIAHKFHDKSKN